MKINFKLLPISSKEKKPSTLLNTSLQGKAALNEKIIGFAIQSKRFLTSLKG